MIDKTASVGIDEFKMLKEFLEEIVNSIGPISQQENRVAVMTFHETPKVWNYFDDESSYNQQQLIDLIRAIPEKLGHQTRTDRAVEKAREVFTAAKGDRPENNNVLILFTDGKTHADSTPYEEITPSLQVM